MLRPGVDPLKPNRTRPNPDQQTQRDLAVAWQWSILALAVGLVSKGNRKRLQIPLAQRIVEGSLIVTAQFLDFGKQPSPMKAVIHTKLKFGLLQTHKEENETEIAIWSRQHSPPSLDLVPIG